MEFFAPLVLFVYNRPIHTQRTLEFLQKNKGANQTEIVVFSDGAKSAKDNENVKRVREIIHSITGFKNITIFEQPKNIGLANSVIKGVSQVVNSFGSAIVLEDDILTSPNFIQFMNNCLVQYENNNTIFSVSGYTLPIQIPSSYSPTVYLSYRGSSWGWGIWKDRWNSIDWDVKDFEQLRKSKVEQKQFNMGGNDLYDMLCKQQNKLVDSWAIRFAYSAHKQNMVHILPTVSKVFNIGNDNSGQHSKRSKKYDVKIDTNTNSDIEALPNNIEINPDIVNAIYKLMKLNIIQKAKSTIRRFKNN